MLKAHMLNQLKTGKCPRKSLQLWPKFHSRFLQNNFDDYCNPLTHAWWGLMMILTNGIVQPELFNRNCVILWTNRARCLLKQIFDLLIEESISGARSGRAIQREVLLWIFEKVSQLLKYDSNIVLSTKHVYNIYGHQHQPPYLARAVYVG